jgi:hypothetical protein
VLITEVPFAAMLTEWDASRVPDGLKKCRVPLTEVPKVFCRITTVVWLPALLKRETL